MSSTIFGELAQNTVMEPFDASDFGKSSSFPVSVPYPACLRPPRHGMIPKHQQTRKGEPWEVNPHQDREFI